MQSIYEFIKSHGVKVLHTDSLSEDLFSECVRKKDLTPIYDIIREIGTCINIGEEATDNDYIYCMFGTSVFGNQYVNFHTPSNAIYVINYSNGRCTPENPIVYLGDKSLEKWSNNAIRRDPKSKYIAELYRLDEYTTENLLTILNKFYIADVY